MNYILAMFALTAVLVVGAKTVPTTTTMPDPHNDLRCYDNDGDFDPDLGDDDVDCGNWPPQ